MKIVVDIDEDTYKDIKKGIIYSSVRDVPQESVLAIANGTPLPEHHGRLIDADELYGDFIDGTEGYDCQTWNRIEIGDIIEDAPTIIEGE